MKNENIQLVHKWVYSVYVYKLRMSSYCIKPLPEMALEIAVREISKWLGHEAMPPQSVYYKKWSQGETNQEHMNSGFTGNLEA